MRFLSVAARRNRGDLSEHLTFSARHKPTSSAMSLKIYYTWNFYTDRTCDEHGELRQTIIKMVRGDGDAIAQYLEHMIKTGEGDNVSPDLTCVHGRWQSGDEQANCSVATQKQLIAKIHRTLALNGLETVD